MYIKRSRIKCVALSVLSLITISASLYADLNLAFDNLTTPRDISPKVKFANNISIAKSEGQKFLRLQTGDKGDNNWIKIPTSIGKPGNYFLSFDWRSSGYGAGLVFRISDTNHNIKVVDMVFEQRTFIITSHTGRKYKRRRLTKLEKNIWYTISINVTGDNYKITVSKRATSETIYDSSTTKKEFKIKRSVAPKVLMFAQWPGQGILNFDYDNIKMSAK